MHPHDMSPDLVDEGEAASILGIEVENLINSPNPPVSPLNVSDDEIVPVMRWSRTELLEYLSRQVDE